MMKMKSLFDMETKTTTIRELIERLREFPVQITVLQWGTMPPVRQPVRKSIRTVGELIAWLCQFPKKKKIEQLIIKMEDEFGYPMQIEFGIYETLDQRYRLDFDKMKNI